MPAPSCPTYQRRRRAACLIALFTCLMLLGAGCGEGAGPQSAVPTVAPAFRSETPQSLPTSVSAAQFVPTPPSLGAAVSGQKDAGFTEIPIYDDQLNSDWSLDQSSLMRYDTQSDRLTQSGRVAIEAEPRSGYASLFFTVRQEARRRYSADQILGVRFWVNGGPNAIGPEDLIVTVMGSNVFPYWRDDDTSVEAAGRITDGGTIFDEQRIFFLGFKNGIPANTWAEVIVWLDERVLDPEYTYFTGLYIKNDEFFVKPLYIDDVGLLVAQ